MFLEITGLLLQKPLHKSRVDPNFEIAHLEDFQFEDGRAMNFPPCLLFSERVPQHVEK